jgi:hypothetical protein
MNLIQGKAILLQANFTSGILRRISRIHKPVEDELSKSGGTLQRRTRV